ncbi:MAG: hypothetical protein FRX48_01632 [Lasallia pustulata]|uniref:Uncharacterized protein n=1 Tax=Lasallia pustulata TaxID=136370 RepID=A0A5M8Q0L2_9LECA|nr:MAG: hypothetical protein FRX48_01632 [Lasallia pustulata]
MYGPRRPFPDGNDRAGRCYPAGGMGGGFSGRRSPSPNYSDHDTVPAVDEDSSSEGSFASSRYDLPSDLRGGYGGGYGPRGGHGREYRSLGGHGREYRSLGGHGREYRSLGGHGGGYGPRGGHGGGYGPRGGHSGGYGPRDDDGDDDDGDDDDGDDDDGDDDDGDDDDGDDDDGDDDDGDDDDGDDDDGDDDDGDDDDGDDLDGDDDGNPGFWVATRSGSNFFIARDRVTEISYQTTTPTNPGPGRGGYRGMTPGMEGPGGRYGEQGGMTLDEAGVAKEGLGVRFMAKEGLKMSLAGFMAQEDLKMTLLLGKELGTAMGLPVLLLGGVGNAGLVAHGNTLMVEACSLIAGTSRGRPGGISEVMLASVRGIVYNKYSTISNKLLRRIMPSDSDATTL